VFLSERRFLTGALADKHTSSIKAYDALFDRILAGCLPAMARRDRKLLRFAILGMINWIPEWYDPGGSVSKTGIRKFMQQSTNALFEGVGTPASTRRERAGMEIDGKVALITGGASGLGRATVGELITRGARVVVADLPRTASAVEGSVDLAFHPTDETDETQMRAAVDFAVEHFGGLHIAVACAGVHRPVRLSRPVGLERHDPGDERVEGGGRVIDVDLVEHPLARTAQRHVVELLGPVDSYSQHEHPPPYGVSRMVRTKARRRADGPVLVGQHPCGRQAFGAVLQGRRLTSVLEGQALEAFPTGDPYVCGR
jgi:NAD(P)-dependent dehydrogenase (short-subunit alcohol dehydrogenase family)